MRFPFADQPDTACITCRHILERTKRITYVSHDSDDGIWQFLCSEDHTMDDMRVIGLSEAFMIDPSIGQIADMHLGCYIQRDENDAGWKKRKK